MAFLLFLMGLSLLGVFDLGISFMGIGSRLAGRHGLSGSFFTGVLATVVATPCTAPFMGPAVGFALTQSAAVSLSVFLALAAGMAFPYLVLVHVPPFLHRLPRPGSWMQTFQQAMAFPLFATVLWLLWVLEKQAPEGLTPVLGGILLLGFGVWLGGRVKKARPLALLLAVLGLAIGWVEVSKSTRDASMSDGWIPFAPATVQALRAEGKAVFIDFTAAWCITCQVNKRAVLNREEVRRAFEEKGVALIRADWTNKDPEISRALSRFGREGVPLYVYYPPGEEARLLPTLLTKAIVVRFLEGGT